MSGYVDDYPMPRLPDDLLDDTDPPKINLERRVRLAISMSLERFLKQPLWIPPWERKQVARRNRK